MKKIILSVFLFLSVVFVSAQLGTYANLTITGATLNQTYYGNIPPNTLWLNHGGGVTMTGNVNIGVSSAPPNGTRWTVYNPVGIDLNGHTFCAFDFCYSQADLDYASKIEFVMENGVMLPSLYAIDPDEVWLSGNAILPASIAFNKLVTPITPADLDTVGEGRILIGNSSDELESKFFGTNLYIGIGDGTTYNSVAQSGDVIYSNAGVSAIQSGVIVNADVNASAAIARTKLASGSASYVLVNSGAGVMSEEQYLSASRGGLATDVSGATGFVTFNGGTASVGTVTDVRGLDNLSFVTANQGIYYLYFPFAATATNINCRVTSVVSGTDDGTIEVANNSGTVMAGSSLTAGQLTIAASAAFGTGYSSTLTSNNTFAATESLRLTTAKTTSGGVLHCDVTYTRNN